MYLICSAGWLLNIFYYLSNNIGGHFSYASNPVMVEDNPETHFSANVGSPVSSLQYNSHNIKTTCESIHCIESLQKSGISRQGEP